MKKFRIFLLLSVITFSVINITKLYLLNNQNDIINLWGISNVALAVCENPYNNECSQDETFTDEVQFSYDHGYHEWTEDGCSCTYEWEETYCEYEVGSECRWISYEYSQCS